MRSRLLLLSQLRSTLRIFLAGQLGPTYTFGGTQYRLVLVPTMNAYLPELKQNISYDEINSLWHGIISSVDNGKTWTKFYTVNNNLGTDNIVTRQNPVGMFERNSVLYVDISDTHGAGSGEGYVTRLETTDAGKSWKKVGCYYLLPESYYVADGTIVPEGIKASNGCEDYKI